MPPLPHDFAPRLIAWYQLHRRRLPWRETRDPYRVWVSEIMLQQTRVETVRSYYTRFMEVLPSVETLAAAGEETVMKLWAGLGYYRRARLLHECARVVAAAGRFPSTAAELRRLPGIGRYTAGAIASIAFDEAAPAVDGNVLRVLTRFRAAPVTTGAAERLLSRHYRRGECGDFTQSLMELGATVCLPHGEPECVRCPLAGDCRARALGTPTAFPPPAVKVARKVKLRTVLLLRHNGRIALRRRPETGVLAGMWELPSIAGENPEWGRAFGTVAAEFRSRHIFTHLEWRMLFLVVDCETESPEFVWSFPGEHPLPEAFAKLLRRADGDGEGNTSR
ncbi:MAG: A/G-specific adenine glycosylase [Lentisphaeria bacterium]|nr:A/G-specific adenine glycosylase [Lentisphaeria bacterium]